MDKDITTLLSDLRKESDGTLQSINSLENSRGKALAYTSLQKGRMYLGELCLLLGSKNPYKETDNATTADGIQKAVDLAVTYQEIKGNEIEQLNALRKQLGEDVENIDFIVSRIDATVVLSKFELNCKASEAYRGFVEARMWLGVRLGEIRDNSKK